MKVLVFGASGTVGFPVAQAFVRGGHVVYGLTRSKDKAVHLAKEEIIPVVGEITNPEVWTSLVASLDVIVDVCRGDDFDDTRSDLPVVAAAEAAKKLRPTHAPKLTFIATTGTWEFGNNRKEIKSDTTPLTEPIPILAFQPEAEHKILTDPVLNGIVIRPGVVYGRGGSILAPLFKSAYEGKVAWYGSPGTRYQTVHADDLAQLYLLAAEKAHLVGGKAFVGVNDMTESLDDFLQQLVVVSGAKGPYEYIKADSPFTEAMGTTTLIRPYLARTLLGWRPVKAGLVDGLETYYNAWKASAGLE